MMLLVIRDLAASVALTRSKEARQDTVKLFDRQIFTHVTVRAGAQCRMHLLLIVANPGENNDRDFGVNFADKRNKRNPIHLRHLKIDNHHVAIVVGEPGGSLEAFGERLARVPPLAKVSDEKLADPRVIIDDQELRIISIGRVHSVPIISIIDRAVTLPIAPYRRANRREMLSFFLAVPSTARPCSFTFELLFQ